MLGAKEVFMYQGSQMCLTSLKKNNKQNKTNQPTTPPPLPHGSFHGANDMNMFCC